MRFTCKHTWYHLITFVYNCFQYLWKDFFVAVSSKNTFFMGKHYKLGKHLVWRPIAVTVVSSPIPLYNANVWVPSYNVFYCQISGQMSYVIVWLLLYYMICNLKEITDLCQWLRGVMWQYQWTSSYEVLKILWVSCKWKIFTSNIDKRTFK